ncbi:MAG: hypothetical protein JNK76_24065 [Planctomycetales bacterium]|nr:hypothetical protein [Planctomycetales bacterium]MBN8629115.1 hypothetical protein [Planctomycetota bacterium]
MPSDISSARYILREADGVKWLRAGVSRTLPAAEFVGLFREYDTVIRAKRPLTLTKDIEGRQVAFNYERGDALAAVALKDEEKVLAQLAKEGADESAFIMSPGAKRGGGGILK